MLVNGTARETPVGPPWITTSSGYLRDGSKSAGLCRTPSIVAPSWLFHDTSSSVLGRPARGLRVHVREFFRLRASG